MICGESTFTRAEITTLLIAEGLEPGSEAFGEAVRKRFVDTEVDNEKNERLYIECND